MSRSDHERDDELEGYEPPAVEDLDRETDAGPAVTAAGADSLTAPG
jgi:hypothetical protein